MRVSSCWSDHSTSPFLQSCSAFDGPCWNIFKEGGKLGRAEGTAEGISENKIALKIRQGGGEQSAGWVRALRRMCEAGPAGRASTSARPTARGKGTWHRTRLGPRAPPGRGWKPDSELGTGRQKTTRPTSEEPVAHRRLLLSQTLQPCRLGEVEGLCGATARWGLRTPDGLPPGEMEETHLWSPALQQLLSRPGG